MNPLEHIRQQLQHAVDLLNRNQIEECFVLCKEIQQGIGELQVDNNPISEINEQNSTILRRLNRIMVEQIKERKYQHKQ